MRVLTAVATIALLTACAGGDAESSAADSTAAAMPAPMTLADFAGTWENTTILATTPPDTVTSTLSGTADAASWTMTLEGRPNIPLTVSIVGDSLISQSAEYESILRAGVMVTVRTAAVKQGEMIIGTLIATYKTPEGDQVVNGTLHGMKKMQ